jgi:hypothetical protein
MDNVPSVDQQRTAAESNAGRIATRFLALTGARPSAA